MKVFVLGGDGFCGWPCAVNLADAGHEVVVIDNLSRRKIDVDLEVESLTPIATMGDRLKAWEQVAASRCGLSIWTSLGNTTGFWSYYATSGPIRWCILPSSAQLPTR